MARASGGELYDLIYRSDATSPARTMIERLRKRPENLVVAITDPPAGPEGLDYSRPDTVWASNVRGTVANGTTQVTTRVEAAGSADITERQYFRDTIRGRLRGGFGADAKPAFAVAANELLPNCVSSGFAIEQVRSLTDGVAKTALGFRIGSPCAYLPARPAGAADPDVALLGMNVILRSLLAPVLPAGIDYMIVDRDDPHRRVLFHPISAARPDRDARGYAARTRRAAGGGPPPPA